MGTFTCSASHPATAAPPDDAQALCASLHAGAVHVIEATPESSALAKSAASLVHEALGAAGSSEARAATDPYQRLETVRKALGEASSFREHIAGVCRSLGFAPSTQVDAPRLRCITAGAEQEPAAAPVYVLHRDTWYGCPQRLLVAWIPLHDVTRAEVFALYPEWFSRALPNSSGAHDQAVWMKEVGWHGDAPIERFAAPSENFERGEEVRFAMKAGSLLLFSAAQLHQTLPNPTPGNTRYSLDFRILPPGSSEAPNADNKSLGEQARLDGEFWAIG